MLEVKRSFEKHNPGLTVEVKDIRSNDLADSLRQNYQTGNYNCDVMIYSDNDALLSREFIPGGLAYKYVPYDIAPKLKPGHNTDQLVFLGEMVQVFYNTEVYDQPPITNWWQLTEPRFYGRIYIANPLRGSTTIGALLALLQNHELLAQSYRALYGSEPALAPGGTAAELFITKLFENGLRITNSSDEIAQMVGMPGQTDPPLGIMVSSKARLRGIGYAIAPIYRLEPFVGVYTPNSIMIAGGAKNINTAKLFIRWILGEADGQGEGYQPYLQEGTWSCREDVASQSGIDLEAIPHLTLDKEYIYHNREAFTQFWVELQGRFQAE